MNKANKLTDSARLVNRASDMMSNSSSFMKTAMNGTDVTQLVKTTKQSRVIDKLKDTVASVGNKFKSSKPSLNNIGAVDTRILSPSKWDDMVLDGGVLKKGGTSTVSKKARLLREGGNGTVVEVKSFSEADNLLKEAFPDYQKVKGIGAQDANGIRKKNKLDRFKQGGAYHKDYAVNSETGRIYGHAEDNPHGQYPHINIKRTDGKNVMINIIRGTKR